MTITPIKEGAGISASETSRETLYNLIEQQPFFKGLTERHLQLLTDSAMEMRYEPGQSIFEQGSRPISFT